MRSPKPHARQNFSILPLSIPRGQDRAIGYIHYIIRNASHKLCARHPILSFLDGIPYRCR